MGLGCHKSMILKKLFGIYFKEETYAHLSFIPSVILDLHQNIETISFLQLIPYYHCYKSKDLGPEQLTKLYISMVKLFSFASIVVTLLLQCGIS